MTRILIVSKLHHNRAQNVLEFEDYETALDVWALNTGFHTLGAETAFADYRDWQNGEFSALYDKGYEAGSSLEPFDLVVFHGPIDGTSATGTVLSISERADELGRVTVSDYRTVLHNLDKKYLLDLEALGVPIPYTALSLADGVRARLAAGKRMVVKPRRGARAEDFHFVDHVDQLGALVGRDDAYVIQEYRDEFSLGEFSLVFIGRDYRFAWSRSQTARSRPFNNFSKGGRYDAFSPSEEELAFGHRVVGAYESLGYRIDFARVDYIRGREGLLVNEVEVFTPAIETRFDTGAVPYGLVFAKHCLALL